MTIVIPSDRFLKNFHKKVNWTDSNESISFSGTTITVSHGEPGITWGIGAFGKPSGNYEGLYVVFNLSISDGMSYGGRISNTSFAVRSYSKDLGASALSPNMFDSSSTNIYLESCWLDDAQREVRFRFRSSGSTTTLQAEADFYLYKGSFIT